MLLLLKMRQSAEVTGMTPALTVLTSDLHAWARFEERNAETIFAELKVENGSRIFDR